VPDRTRHVAPPRFEARMDLGYVVSVLLAQAA
jgi:hypothetical protein